MLTITKGQLLNKLRTCNNVYAPDDDSYILIEAVDNIDNTFNTALDMCCGTGIIGIYAANKSNKLTFCDILPDAVECAKMNCNIFGINADFIVSDLFENVKEKFDLIMFNPPYLPTNKNTRIKGKLNVALDGGANGRQIIDRFIHEFEAHLTVNGKVLMVSSSLSNTDKTVQTLINKGYIVKRVAEKSLFFEKLTVLLVAR